MENNILDTTINLTVTAGEVNLVLSALSKLPYEAVNAVIEKIKSQGDLQMKLALVPNTSGGAPAIEADTAQ